MSNDHKLLWQQVKSLARDDRMVARAREKLSGLLEAADRGIFDLSTDLFTDRKELAKALAAALRQPAGDVLLVSLTDDETMDFCELSQHEVCSLNRGFKLGPSLWESLWEKHHWYWQESFRKGPGEAVRQRLEKVLRVTIGRKLETAIWNTLEGAGRWEAHRACIANGVWDCVLYYLGFVVLGDKERAGRLEQLIKLLPDVLFFSSRGDESGSWLVLIS